MSELFDKLTPPQLTAVFCTVAGVVALVVFIVSIWSYQVRALADSTALQRERQAADIALKQELVRRNLPAAELKLALEAVESTSRAPVPEFGAESDDGEDQDARARVLKTLAACGDGVANALIEETVTLVTAADGRKVQVLADVLDECVENGQSGQTTYVIARAFCKSAAKEPACPPVKAEPAAESAAKPPIDLQFERSFGTN
jgi:hypothetical protein